MALANSIKAYFANIDKISDDDSFSSSIQLSLFGEGDLNVAS